jgi:Domain of unknown function (DUF4340)
VSLEVNLGPGGQRSLDLGSKTGDQYYARDTSRNMVFLVPASLEKQLDQTLFALRDKRLLRELPDSFTRIDYHAGTFQFSCGVDKSGKWTMFAPAADKGKAVENWKVFDPLSSANALAILDSPSPALMAEVAHPVIEIDLTRRRSFVSRNRWARTSTSGSTTRAVSIASTSKRTIHCSSRRPPTSCNDALTFLR